MRKFLIVGVLAAVLAVAGGVVFAQTDTDDDTNTAGAWLGVAIGEQDEQVVVTRVIAGSPADAAGLLIGDVIVSFNGEAVTSATQLTELVQASAPGDAASLEILRDEETVTVEVTLGDLADYGRGRGRFDDDFIFPQIADGVSFVEMLLVADLEESDNGYEVLDVFSLHNPFELQEGDVVTAINDIAVADFDMQALVESMTGTPSLAVTILRGGEELTLEGDGFGMRGFGMPGFGFHFRDGFGMPGFDGHGFGFPPEGRGNHGRRGQSSTTVPALPAGSQA